MNGREFAAIVVGGGPAGLTAAVALAGSGVPTALAARPFHPDNRTTALLAGSVTALETIGVWRDCRAAAAPLKVMRLVDDTRRLIRAPEVTFDAAEIGHESFGFNIENRHLVAALEHRAAGLPALTRFGAATDIRPEADGVTVRLVDGTALRAKLVVGADGRHSACRAAAGIATDRRSYPQVALTLTLVHARPHRDVSTEFHAESGPFTLVPLPGNRSSVVWVVDPAEAERLGRLDDATLGVEAERRAHAMLGRMTVEPGRGAFPLATETARRFGAGRIVLIGEAAHVMPPIGAQGLNLGLRDAAAIAELVAAARRDGRDVGADAVVAAYDRQRRPDVANRTLAVDMLNGSLLTDFLPVQCARGLGLYLLDRIGPLRRAAMRAGLAPPGTTPPRLMRGEALEGR